MKCKHVITASALLSLFVGLAVVGTNHIINNNSETRDNDNIYNEKEVDPTTSSNESNDDEYYQVEIYCKDCLVKKSTETTYRSSYSQFLPAGDLVFNLKKGLNPKAISLPDTISFKINGEVAQETIDYIYKPSTGNLSFTLKGTTLIEVDAYYGEVLSFDFDATDGGMVKFAYNGGLDYVDWGDGTTDSLTYHNFSPSYDTTYTVKVFGDTISGFALSNEDGILASGNINVNYVRMNSPMKSILSFGFKGCYGLGKVDMPDTLKFIGERAFEETDVKKIAIPDSVTAANGAFAGAEYLREVDFPENSIRKSIDDRMFYECESLSKIILPDSIETIGHEAFFGCRNLTDLDMPKNLRSFGSNVFSECQKLHRINLIKTDAIVGAGEGLFDYMPEVPLICVMEDDYDDYYNSKSWDYYKDNLISEGDLHFSFTSLSSLGQAILFYQCGNVEPIDLEYRIYRPDEGFVWKDLEFNNGRAVINYSEYMEPYGITVRAKTRNEHIGTSLSDRYAIYTEGSDSVVRVSGFINSLFYNSEIYGLNTMINAPCPDFSFVQFFNENESREFDCSGLILSSPEVGESAYRNMFEESSTILAPIFYNPMSLSTNSCYQMFERAEKLIGVTKLPIVNLADGCCSYMFDYCVNLRVGPDLPCTELREACYMGMFGSTSLEYPMNLPATSFANGCYSFMFYDCMFVYSTLETEASPYNTKFFVCSDTEKADKYANSMFNSTPTEGTTYYYK